MRDISELDQDAMRLRVSWAKANNYHKSFATLFWEDKKKFDNNEYPGWTFAMWLGQKVGIFEDQVIKKLKTYDNVIASEEREKTAAENRRLEMERLEARKKALEEQEKKRKEIEIQKAINAARKAEVKAVKDAKAAQKKKDEVNKKRREIAKRKKAIPIIHDGSLEQLANEIHNGKKRAENGRQEWILGTMEVVIALSAAREKFISDNVFHDWLDQNKVDYKKNDRAALIKFGEEPERIRKVLEETTRISYRTIYDNEWRFPNVGKPEIIE